MTFQASGSWGGGIRRRGEVLLLGCSLVLTHDQQASYDQRAAEELCFRWVLAARHPCGDDGNDRDKVLNDGCMCGSGMANTEVPHWQCEP